MGKSVKYASKKLSFGVIAFCVGIMASAVLQGMKLDREEAEQRALEEAKARENEKED